MVILGGYDLKIQEFSWIGVQHLPETLTLHGESEKIGPMMIFWPPRFQIEWCLNKTTLKGNLKNSLLANEKNYVIKNSNS